MENLTLHLPDIGCEGCVRAIRNELEDMAGVQLLAADVESRNVTLAWDAPATEQAIVQALTEIGYAPAPA